MLVFQSIGVGIVLLFMFKLTLNVLFFFAPDKENLFNIYDVSGTSHNSGLDKTQKLYMACDIQRN